MSADMQAAVYAAIDCLPMDLCRIILAYAARRPHTFNADGFDGSLSPPTAKNVDGQSNLMVDRRLNGDRSANLWKTFVSEETLTDGIAEWSVAWSTPDFGYKSGWIGIGVSLSAANRLNRTNASYAGIAGQDDWILADLSVSGYDDLSLYHDGILRMDMPVSLRKIWFRADPVGGTVVARWRRPVATGSDRRSYRWFDATRSLPTADFARLRPAVVLAGCATAVVQSAPDDMPADDDCQQLVILTVR